MDRYEEALAKARAEYEKAREQGYTWLMNLLEGMFPDLKESEDERIRRHLIDIVETYWGTTNDPGKAADLAWLEKQKDASKAIEAVDRIDKYIDEHVVIAHDMKNSHPDKKYYSGWDDALAKMSGILQDVYSGEKKKESLHITEMCKENAGSFTDEDEDRTINGCLLAANAERRCKRASEELLEELGLADYTKFFYEQGVEKGKKEREKQKEQKNFQTKVQQRMEYLWDKLPDSHKVENGDCTPEEWKTLGAYMELEMNFDEDGFVKQKEQKPAEIISQLTVQGKGVYKICPHCKERMVRDDSKVYTSMPPQYGYNCPKCGTMEFDTVMYDNPEMEEQKPVEWSKNDTVFLNEITDFFENKTVRLQHDIDMYAHWLKSLPERFNLQPKQEWSEEDKGNLLDVKCIIDIDEVWHNQYVREEIDHSGEELESLWHWLDNIWQKVEYPHPHWKPSEEQIGTLKQWLQDHELDGDSRYVYPVFYSLLTDLQKLL